MRNGCSVRTFVSRSLLKRDVEKKRNKSSCFDGLFDGMYVNVRYHAYWLYINWVPILSTFLSTLIFARQTPVCFRVCTAWNLAKLSRKNHPVIDYATPNKDAKKCYKRLQKDLAADNVCASCFQVSHVSIFWGLLWSTHISDFWFCWNSNDDCYWNVLTRSSCAPPVITHGNGTSTMSCLFHL